MKRLRLLFASAALLSGVSYAQGPDVAIVAAASATLSDCRYVDVQSYLQATGLFGNIDIIDCVTQTPSLTELQSYSSLLTWTNVDYFNPNALGDVFADYVDGGGGVVSAVFSTSSTASDRQLDGRWKTGGYEVILAGQGNLTSTATLGTVLDPAHPSMLGVSALTATSAFRPLTSTGLVQGTVVAEWNDGSILVAQGAMPNRIDLGLYPPSSACSGAFWDASGDGDILIANALLAVAGGGPPGTNYCMANANQTGQVAVMAASGSNFAASNDLTLSASSLPPLAFAFFITSQDQTFVMNPAGSEGNLCIGGAIGRFVGPGQVQQADMSGGVQLTVNLTAIPQPLGFITVQPGDTWNFQAWHRDSAAGVSTSNFTDGYSITFL